MLAAAAAIGVAWWLAGLAALAVIVHGIAAWPAATPTPIFVAGDGCCWIPALGAAWLVPGPRTRLAAYWLLLSLEGGGSRHDILLCVDQVDAASWARLNALLRRRPAAGTRAEARPQRTGRADLR